MIARISLRIPGSSANIGPGFDTLGLALAIYNNVSFEIDEALKQPEIICEGTASQNLPRDTSNLIYRTFASLWRGEQTVLQRLRIRIESDIPLARGLGSSGTAILAAVYAAQALNGSKPDPSAVLTQATALEGHPDNLAASLFGGMIVCSQSNSSHVTTNGLNWPAQWGTLVVVPPYELETKKARAVIPRKISKEDAVFNLQKLGLLISAVTTADEDAMKAALVDRLHEPYREPLVPELGSLRKELRSSAAFGCVLSGAGPSILVPFNRRKRAAVYEQVENWAQRQPNKPQILDLQVDQEGLRQI